jgi:hypothetical protein
MASPASTVMAMPEAGHLEQLPVSPAPAAADVWTPARDVSAPALGDNRPRPLEAAVCSLCGVARPLGLLVADGSLACTDIHWYCKDVKSCTERWTAARSR